MAYVQIPRDLSNIKEKFILGLTKRQVLFFGIGGAVGIGVFLLIKDINFSAGIAGIIISVMPFAFLGMYEKNKLPFDRYLKYYIRANFFRKKLRPYKTQNMYAAIEDMAYFEREAKKVGYKRSFKTKIAAAFEAADKIKLRRKAKK